MTTPTPQDNKFARSLARSFAGSGRICFNKHPTAQQRQQVTAFILKTPTVLSRSIGHRRHQTVDPNSAASTAALKSPFAQAAPLQSIHRGFLPWRLSAAGRRCTPNSSPAAGIRNLSQKRPNCCSPQNGAMAQSGQLRTAEKASISAWRRAGFSLGPRRFSPDAPTPTRSRTVQTGPKG